MHDMLSSRDAYNLNQSVVEKLPSFVKLVSPFRMPIHSITVHYAAHHGVRYPMVGNFWGYKLLRSSYIQASEIYSFLIFAVGESGTHIS